MINRGRLRALEGLAPEPGGDAGLSLAGSHPSFAGLTTDEKGGHSA